MTRIAVALEGIAVTGDGGAAGNRSKPLVVWSLKHSSGDTYILENEGEAVAYDVQLRAHESLMTPGEWPARRDLGPREAMTFMAAATYGTSDSTITVEWSNADSEEAEREIWRYPLPPRPPR